MAKKAIFDKKNILVIGGAGFIGSHLCDELVQDNKVICVDNFSTGSENNITHLYQNSNFEFVNHDITTPLDLEKAAGLENFKVEFQGVQEIYFLASPASPAAYSQKTIETMLANSIGLNNALALAVKYKAKFLYASAAAVYGDLVEEESVAEDFIGRSGQFGSRGAYREAKKFGEALVVNYSQQNNLDVKIARIFNAYGPRLQLNDGRMIPEMIKSALAKEVIVIYGDEGDKGSYLFISDLVKGLISLMGSGESEPMNFGSDFAVSFNEVAKKISALAKSEAGTTYEMRRDYMAEQLIPNISAAKEKLGWFPIVLLDQGLKETFDYLSAQKDLLGPGGMK